MTIVAVLLGGCAPQHEPPAAAYAVTTVHKPVAGSAEESAGSETASRLTDAFGLPLVIVMENVEVPPEIRGPSPPIKK